MKIFKKVSLILLSVATVSLFACKEAAEQTNVVIKPIATSDKDKTQATTVITIEGVEHSFNEKISCYILNKKVTSIPFENKQITFQIEEQNKAENKWRITYIKLHENSRKNLTYKSKEHQVDYDGRAIKGTSVMIHGNQDIKVSFDVKCFG